MNADDNITTTKNGGAETPSSQLSAPGTPSSSAPRSPIPQQQPQQQIQAGKNSPPQPPPPPTTHIVQMEAAPDATSPVKKKGGFMSSFCPGVLDGEEGEEEGVSRRSAFDEIADSDVRIDRPHDVALEYNRTMLHRYCILLFLFSLPLLYLTPVVGVLLAPSAFLVGYWSSQRARFQHGGDMRACVNRDCSIVVGIVFICVALLIDVFNVADLLLEKGKGTTSTASGKKISSINMATTIRPQEGNKIVYLTTTTTTMVTKNNNGNLPPGGGEIVEHSLPPEVVYAHKHEEASQKSYLRKLEVFCGCLVFLPAAATLRYLFRVRSLVMSPIGDEGEQ